MSRIFAIGDIHGCCKTFKKLILEKIQLTKNDIIYCIGDYIDRGNDSKGVIDFILQLQADGYTVFTLRGNHEQMMLDSIHHKKALSLWLENGGKATLKSFGINKIAGMDEKYWGFFHDTKMFVATDKYIFVHAGLNFNAANIFEDQEAMLWIRDFSCDSPALEERLLIHGHTPTPLEEILAQKNQCINIDAGCVFKDNFELGNLLAIELPARNYIWQKNCEEADA